MNMENVTSDIDFVIYKVTTQALCVHISVTTLTLYVGAFDIWLMIAERKLRFARFSQIYKNTKAGMAIIFVQRSDEAILK